MITYFDKVKYLHPDLQGFSYWHTQYNGEPWKNPYDGLVWDNQQVEKPSQAALDTLEDTVVESELTARDEAARKAVRDSAAKNDVTVLAGFDIYKQASPAATLSDYLDYLETLAQD